MTHKSPETFRAFLECLEASPKYASAARNLGCTPATLFRWVSESKLAAAAGEERSVYWFSYADAEDWLHIHVKHASRQAISRIEQAAMERAEHGTWMISKFQGQTVYETDPDLISVDDETLKILGLPDRLKRDAAGHPMPSLVWTPPSTDLTMALLSANMRRYSKRSEVNMNIDARVSGGVFVAGPQQKIETKPLPILEVLPNPEPERVLVDEPSGQDDDLDDLLGPAPIVAQRPRPPAISHGPLTELQRDLLAKARAKGIPVAPIAATVAPISDDNNPARMGRGTVPPGGIKTR